jgi:hypothetical protein
MPISIGSDASYDSGTVYSLQTILFSKKLCGLTFLLQLEVLLGLFRFCMHSGFPFVSAILERYTIMRVYPSETV